MKVTETPNGFELVAVSRTYPCVFVTREQAETVGAAAEEAERKRLVRQAQKDMREKKKMAT